MFWKKKSYDRMTAEELRDEFNDKYYSILSAYKMRELSAEVTIDDSHIDTRELDDSGYFVLQDITYAKILLRERHEIIKRIGIKNKDIVMLLENESVLSSIIDKVKSFMWSKGCYSLTFTRPAGCSFLQMTESGHFELRAYGEVYGELYDE